MTESVRAETAELVRLGALIDKIYQGAADPDRWNEILPEIADWLNARFALLFTPLHAPDAGGFYFNHAIPESVMHLWATKWLNQDVLANAIVQKGLFVEGNVMIGEEVLPFEQISATPIYRELNHPNGIDHVLAGAVFDFKSLGVIPTALTLYRSVGQGPFSVDERERLRMLLPHVSRSFGVMARLRDADMRVAASHSALDRLASGVLLLGDRGQVVFANRMARRILEEGDGISLHRGYMGVSWGELVAEDRETQAALDSAIGRSISPDIYNTEHFSRAVSVPRPSRRQDYLLNFSSLAAGNEFGVGTDVPRAIAFITDSADPVRLDAELLMRTYGLTPAETRIVQLIAECLTVDEVAERLGVSRHTVKTQLQNVYDKTRTNNRAKLMKLIMSLASVRE